MSKEFRKSTSNVVGTDMSRYKIVEPGKFACDFMSVIRVHKLPVVLNSEKSPVIVSPAYTVFEVIDERELLPDYLMMWFRRSEFDRYADFRCDSAIRGGFAWDELCEVELPIPSTKKQQEIVNEYYTVTDRIKLYEQLNQKLEDTATTLYKHWFLDFEFPINKEIAESMSKPELEGKPYKTSGGELVYNEKLEKEIPIEWEDILLQEMCECLDGKRRPISKEKRQLIQGGIPYYGAMSIVDYIDDYLYDGTYLLMSEDGANIIDDRGRPALQYVWGKFWVNNHAHILQGRGDFSTEYLMLGLGHQNLSHLVTGAAQPKINQKNMMSIDMIKPDSDTLLRFQGLIKPLFSHKKIIQEESEKLKEVAELLLTFPSLIQRKLEVLAQ